MKAYLTILFCLFLGPVAWAHAPASASPFQPAEGYDGVIHKLMKEVDRLTVAHLNRQVLATMYGNTATKLSIDIPLPGGAQETLVLEEVSVTVPSFTIRTSGNELYTKGFEKARHFRGKVHGRAGSVAALSFTSGEISGVFSFGTGNYNVVALKEKDEHGQSLYAIFNEAELKGKNPFQCHTTELPDVNEKPGKRRETQDKGIKDNCRKVTVYFECDHQMFLDRGATVEATVNWLTSMFNVVAMLYNEENIRLEISQTYIHTQPDFWPGETSHNNLYAFGDSLSVRPFNGNLAHLISTSAGNLGGVAFLDVLCGFPNHAYSNIYNDFMQLPSYSWTVDVIAHEMGHNFGSPHTQSCSWHLPNGEFGMLDSCYTSEEDCYLGPRIPIMGTIMSYCHLVAGKDFTKGFGPLPGNLIRSNYNNAGCLNGSVVFENVAVNQGDTLCSGSAFHLSVTDVAGATYSWTGPNNFSSSLRNPTVDPVTAASAGLYTVVLSKNGCTGFPLQTRLTVNCIAVEPVPDLSICKPATFPIRFRSNINPIAGNIYNVEISNAAGSFATPTVIGSVASTAADVAIPVTIPVSAETGSGFKIRIRSTNPARLGEAGSFSLAVFGAGSAPAVADLARCGVGPLSFSGPATGVTQWFADSISATPLYEGATFVTPSLSADKSYFVQHQGTTKASVGPGDPLFTGEGLAVANFASGLFIQVLKDTRIDSVTVYPEGSGNVVFRVRDSASTKTFAQVVRPVSGGGNAVKILVNITLTPGLYRVDAVGSTVETLFRSLGISIPYPFMAAGQMAIVGSTVDNRYPFFYQWKITSFDCLSPRKKIWARIQPAPQPPAAAPAARCGSGSLKLKASGAPAGAQYRWYTTATGGTPIPGATADSLWTPVLSATTIYSVSILANGCESMWTQVVATINTPPATPDLTAGAICAGGVALLQATGSVQDFTFLWYDEGGNPITGNTTNTLQSPPLFASQKYYVAVKDAQGCTSARDSVTVQVNPRPGAPVTGTFTRCGPGGIVLRASGATNAVVFQWYNESSGGAAIVGAFDSLYTTPMITAGSDTFYVTPINAFGCSLVSRIPIIAQVIDRPPMPVAQDSNRCGPGVVTLSATGAGPGLIYRWYAAASGPVQDSLVGGSAGTFVTPVLTASTAYYVVTSKSAFCESAPRKAVNAIINSIPATPVISVAGAYLVVSYSGTFRWFKNDVQVAVDDDSLLIATFGDGAYHVVYTTTEGCTAQSEAVVVTDIQDLIPSESFVRIFPNPASRTIFLQPQANTGALRVSIFDIQGRELQSVRLVFSNFEPVPIYLKNMAAGTYMLRLVGLDGKQEVQKLLVE